jgi:heme-degrading monooxygenase HmoA
MATSRARPNKGPVGLARMDHSPRADRAREGSPSASADLGDEGWCTGRWDGNLQLRGYGVPRLGRVSRDHPAVPDRALPRPREEWAVYARSTTFHGRPDNIDAGIRFIQSEAAPMLDTIDGCRGLSMLVDHDTGHCIATSSWESEAAMRASDEQLRPIRDRGRDILGGSMQVDEWEIAIMHRTHHGECCRVSWLQGDLDTMTETVRVGILPELEQTPGFCSASLLVNRSTGLCCATTAWETREAMEASRPSADNMRTRTAREAGGEILDVHEFELAYAHLHVPEMA